MEVAFIADLRARLSEVSGTSRLMTLLAADWTLIVSKMDSYATISAQVEKRDRRLTIDKTLQAVRH